VCVCAGLLLITNFVQGYSTRAKNNVSNGMTVAAKELGIRHIFSVHKETSVLQSEV
jgi:hypothetical protein